MSLPEESPDSPATLSKRCEFLIRCVDRQLCLTLILQFSSLLIGLFIKVAVLADLGFLTCALSMCVC